MTSLDRATVAAVAEAVCPSLNGACARRLTLAMEASCADAVHDSLDDDDVEWFEQAVAAVSQDRVEFWRAELVRLGQGGVSMHSVVDSEYPANLRMIHDRPPMVFVRGEVRSTDVRAVAIVGTRRPSDAGLEAAAALSSALAARGVTIVSGLAEGIDTAAHSAAIEAGGRTIAVLGTGIERQYPASNRALAESVVESGACVSQFLPAQPSTRWSFPVRNVVTSGMSIGTIVVEAGEKSGTRLQAEHALRHGKRLFLLESLVRDQAWARELVGRAEVIDTGAFDFVLELIDTELATSLENVF